MAINKFSAAVKKAKGLYKTGKYKNFGAAVKAAYKKPGIVSKKKKKVGAYKVIEKGEKKSTPAKKTYRAVRTKTGTFKGMQKVSGTVHTIGGVSMYTIRDQMERDLKDSVKQLALLKQLKKEKKLFGAGLTMLRNYPKYIATVKKQLREQNKLINQSLR